MIDTDNTLLFIGKVRCKLAQNNFYDPYIIDDISSALKAKEYDYDNTRGLLILKMEKSILCSKGKDVYSVIEPMLQRFYESRSLRLLQILGRDDTERMLSLPSKLFYTVMEMDNSIVVQF